MKTLQRLTSIIRPVAVVLVLSMFVLTSTGVGPVLQHLPGLWFSQKGLPHTRTDAELPPKGEKYESQKAESKKNGHELQLSGLAKAIALLSLGELNVFHSSLIEIGLDTPSPTVPIYLYERSLLI
jgi:hypothetical protein